MLNYFYGSKISDFLSKSQHEIIGEITLANQFSSTPLQNKSWHEQITILKEALMGFEGDIFFEFSIPRMGKRVDAVVIIDNIVLVIEFKIGTHHHHQSHIEQVWDYALDLKYFHQPSYSALLAPVLVASNAKSIPVEISTTPHNDNLLFPVNTNSQDLKQVIETIVGFYKTDTTNLTGDKYSNGIYSPTPTIIEAAVSLYNNHSVENITRSDADATNLTRTTLSISNIIDFAKNNKKKCICFVTGVPGAGKTLVGLKVATQHLDESKGSTSVYLSGNAPLVAILQEALIRDKVNREAELGRKVTKKEVRHAVRSFIQIVHHYRDYCLIHKEAPYDHVAIFDEAQRAWNKEQTVKFMKQKKNQHDFDFSEPEFLISCLDRHEDWAVIVCLVGGGQEINTGEGGISEWFNALKSKFPLWEVFISPNLTDSEYAAEDAIEQVQISHQVDFKKELHLGVSMRSFRAENLSLFVKQILDRNIDGAIKTFDIFKDLYPIALTRDLAKAKAWLKAKARGSERYGIVVSSQAQRLKPFAIDVKSPMNPVNWFLDGKDDVRSSYYLEDVATEFHIQGLELDWVCVTWDGDLRYSNDGWKTFEFRGNKWQNINHPERKKYLINAYRVLLTRARQGMVIVVPEGNPEDHTRKSEFYDSTFHYLSNIGLTLI